MIPKPEHRAKAKARKRRQEYARTRSIREAVFARDQHRCRVCGGPAHEMHELRFRSLGGKRSLANSIAVCNWLGKGCHEDLQQHRIRVVGDDANTVLLFVRES